MSTKHLHLAEKLSVPLNFVTEKHAWIGVTGSGKSYGAQKSAEQLWHARAPFVVLDPVGNWGQGLRLSADGKRPGLPLTIFGGLHGDVPLEPTAGALVADLIFDKHISAVVDVSQFDTDADRGRFVCAFLERLFVRHKRAPTARHIYMEECQEFLPQNPQPGEQRLLHIAQRVQKMGRGVGLGTSLITQRPQDVSKKALNQAQTVFMFRLTGSQERKAMKEWVTAQGLTDGLLAGLPELPTGTCHVWSPAWLQTFVTVKIAPKETFDASATPEVGAKAAVYELAQIDLAGLQEAMAATVEKFKAEDPRELRRQLAVLRGQLAAPPKITHVSAKDIVREKIVEVPVFKDAHIKRLEVAFITFEKANARVEEMLRENRAMIAKAVAMPRGALNGSSMSGARLMIEEAHRRQPSFIPRKEEKPAAAASDANASNLSGPQEKILAALWFFGELGREAVTKVQVALFVGVSPNSGSYANNLGALRSAGLVSYPGIGDLALTDLGRGRAPKVDVPRSNAALHVEIFARVSAPQRAILECLVNNYPHPLRKGHIAEVVGVSPNSGSFANNLGHLRSLGAVDYPAIGMARASDLMFVEGK